MMLGAMLPHMSVMVFPMTGCRCVLRRRSLRRPLLMTVTLSVCCDC